MGGFDGNATTVDSEVLDLLSEDPPRKGGCPLPLDYIGADFAGFRGGNDLDTAMDVLEECTGGANDLDSALDVLDGYTGGDDGDSDDSDSDDDNAPEENEPDDESDNESDNEPDDNNAEEDNEPESADEGRNVALGGGLDVLEDIFMQGLYKTGSGLDVMETILSQGLYYTGGEYIEPTMDDDYKNAMLLEA